MFCEVLAEAEERVEHRVCNKTQANTMAALRLMKLTLGFCLRIKKRSIKQAVAWRGQVATVRHVTSRGLFFN